MLARDLNAHGPMTVLLKDAIRPNVTQTLENNPAIIHGGPFANIAHGCNSVIATKAGLKLADYVVTEAGFGADLGAEKFLDIKCRKSGIKPDCVVIVATIRALKMHGGISKDELKNENVEALKKGLVNLERHINNIRKFGLPVTIAYTRDKKAIYAKDLNAQGPMTVLLKEAIRPNVTQTLENNPAIIHGGPFANIACLLYTSPSPRDLSTSRMPSSA